MAKEEQSNWARIAFWLLAGCFNNLKSSDLLSQQLDAVNSKHIDVLAGRKIDSLLYLGYSLKSPIQNVYDTVWGIQNKWLNILVNRLIESSVSPIIFKGGELLNAYYRSRALGCLADLDILVDRKDLGVAKQCLYSMGFRQSTLDRGSETLVDLDILDIARIESTHYELAPFSKFEEIELEEEEFKCAQKNQPYPLQIIDGKCFVIVQFDIHHRVASDIESDGFFKRAIPSALGCGLTMSPADQIWFMTSRYYNEVAIHGKRSLRDFAYLAPIISRSDISWDIVLSAARIYELRPSLYYYLSFLDKLAGNIIPSEVFDELLPSKGIRSRDWGWQLSKLFDEIDPFPLEL